MIESLSYDWLSTKLSSNPANLSVWEYEYKHYTGIVKHFYVVRMRKHWLEQLGLITSITKNGIFIHLTLDRLGLITSTTTTKPFVPSIRVGYMNQKRIMSDRAHGSAFSIHVFFGLPCALLTCPKLIRSTRRTGALAGLRRTWPNHRRRFFSHLLLYRGYTYFSTNILISHLISPRVTTHPTKHAHLCYTHLLGMMSLYSPTFCAI